MSNSKEVNKVTLNIHLASEEIEVRIFNGYNKEVDFDFSYGENLLELPRGFYTVQWQFYGDFQEKVIRLSENQSFAIKIPKVYSAAPIAGAATTHEYYLGPAIEWSNETHGPSIGDNTNLDSKLFIFIRGVDQKRSKGLPFEGVFSLHNKDGKTVAKLEGAAVQKDPHGPWLAYSVMASSGQYYLRYHGKKLREIPIYLFRGWQIQIFLTYQKRPVFEGMRIFLARFNEGFQANNEEAVFMDRAIHSLSNNLSIPKGQSRFMLNEKLTHPMHGLLWAYIALQRFDVYHDRQNTIKAVIRNLKNHILEDSESPDLKALQILYHQKTGALIDGEPIGDLVLSHPPMFSTGMKAIMEAATEYESMVPVDTVLDRVSADLYIDLVWSSWSFKPDIQLEVGEDTGFEKGSAKRIVNQATDTPDWMLSSIAMSVEESHQKGKRSKSREEISMKTLAKSTKLPLTTMQRTVDSISQNPALKERLAKLVGDMSLETSVGEILDELSRLKRKE